MRLPIFILLTFMFTISFAQKNKNDKIGFCGKVATDKLKMLSQLEDQFAFLQVQENDTIVDIGAASGWFEGAFSAASELANLHFVLVDVDSSCLNQRKVDNMIAHYSLIKGGPITNKFHLVQNSYDSLYLPLATYKKVWLLNVLHEVPNQAKMINDIYNVLKPGGEIILLEMIPKKQGELHGGCRKPLLSLKEWKMLFEKNSFQHKDDLQGNKVGNKTTINMIRFVKSAT